MIFLRIMRYLSTLLVLLVTTGWTPSRQTDAWFNDIAALLPGELCLAGNNSPECLFREDFGNGAMPARFTMRDGLGSYSFVGQPVHLRYAVWGTREKQAGDADVPGFEGHGYSVLPSLQISRPFRGRRWALETHVAFVFPANEHGRAINLKILFDKTQDGKMQHGLLIGRYADGVSGANNLGIAIWDGARLNTKSIELNHDDTYFLKIVRQDNILAVYAAAPGAKYKSILGPLVFKGELPDEQAFAIDGLANNTNRTYADFAFISVRGQGLSELQAAASVSRCNPLQQQGSKDKPLIVSARTILATIKRGCDVDLNYTVIDGPLYLSELVSSAEQPHKPEQDDEYIINSRLRLQNCSLELLSVPVHTLFSKPLQISRCTVDNIMISKAQFAAPVDFSCSTIKNLSITYSSFATNADADFSFLGCENKIEEYPAISADLPYADFRGTQFGRWTTFYAAQFPNGANFSDTRFSGDVSFSSVYFGEATLAFSKAQILGAFYFVSNLERPIRCGSGDLDMSEAHLGQFHMHTDGQQWLCSANLIFTLARINRLCISHVTFKGVLDLSGATFVSDGPAGLYCSPNRSLRFETVRFDADSALRLAEWPARNTELSSQTYLQIQGLYRQSGDIRNERLVYFDALSQPTEPIGSSWYVWWFWKIRRLAFGILWISTEYCTSVFHLLLTGVLCSFLFAVMLTRCEPCPLRRIRSKFQLKLHLKDTPTLSDGEEDLGPALLHLDTLLRNDLGHRLRYFVRKLLLVFSFSWVNFGKVGFGGLRFDPGLVKWKQNARRVLVLLVWAEWALGYAWYFFLLYTLVAAIPILGAASK